MNITAQSKTKDLRPLLLDKIRQKEDEVNRWLKAHEATRLPLYSSVDIRDAGFKMAVVDTNLFPAGFNNLCEHGQKEAIVYFQKAIAKRVPDCKSVLIVAEEHTRNVWYLQNVLVLQQIIQHAGFEARVATFLNFQPDICDSENPYVELKTATDQTLRVHCFKRILENYQNGFENIDLIILNNDLTTGIPEILKASKVPIYPTFKAGWHSRLKSRHFDYTCQLLDELSQIIEVDPWFFSCLSGVVDNVNVNVDEDRNRLRQSAEELFKKIQKKYDQHGIEEKPYIVVKPDAGTYGMGVMSIEDPQELMNLNRRDRNQLYKGKGSRVIERYLLQEGVPTIYNIDNNPSEVCLYQIESNLVGGFFRSNTAKNSRENLNSQGMIFKGMCPLPQQNPGCGVQYDLDVFEIYRLLARVAAIAARKEITKLQAG